MDRPATANGTGRKSPASRWPCYLLLRCVMRLLLPAVYRGQFGGYAAPIALIHCLRVFHPVAIGCDPVVVVAPARRRQIPGRGGGHVAVTSAPVSQWFRRLATVLALSGQAGSLHHLG